MAEEIKTGKRSRRVMTDAMWTEVFVNLSDAYFRATGEIWPAPEKAKIKISVKGATLAEMYERGMTLQQIGALFNCVPSCVEYHLKKAGVTLRKAQDYPKTERQMLQARKNLCGHRKKTTEKPKPAPKAPAKRQRISNGYVLCKCPEHPRADICGYVPEHTLVVEAAIGRFLREDEVVHHINRVRDDNRLENLQLMTRKEHCSLHGKENIGKMRAYLAARAKEEVLNLSDIQAPNCETAG